MSVPGGTVATRGTEERRADGGERSTRGTWSPAISRCRTDFVADAPWEARDVIRAAARGWRSSSSSGTVRSRHG